jgi:hypothetical protein
MKPAPMRFEWRMEGPAADCGAHCRVWISAIGAITEATVRDFEQFATFLEVNVGLPKEQRKYLRKKDPDINRLRLMICSAWKQGKAGFTKDDQNYSASQFASRGMFKPGLSPLRTCMRLPIFRLFSSTGKVCPHRSMAFLISAMA